MQKYQFLAQFYQFGAKRRKRFCIILLSSAFWQQIKKTQFFKKPKKRLKRFFQILHYDTGHHTFLQNMFFTKKRLVFEKNDYIILGLNAINDFLFCSCPRHLKLDFRKNPRFFKI